MKASKMNKIKEYKGEVKGKVVWQWKWMEYLAYAIVVLAPLYFNNNHWYPFGMSKVSIVIGGSLLMALFYAWGAMNTKKLVWKVTPVHIILFVFLSILTISSIFGVDPHNSFFGVFSFPTNLIFIYAVSLFGVLIGFLARNDKRFISNILLSSFLTSIVVAFFSYSGNSIFKFFGDYSSTIGNSSYTGAYLLFNVCFGIGLLFYYKNIWKKVFIGLASLFVLFSPIFFNINIFLGKVSIGDVLSNPMNVLGVANGATIGIFISFVTIFILFLIFSKRKFLKVSGFIFLTILISSLLCISFSFMNPSTRIHKAYVEAKSENRFIAWDIARVGARENPLLGLGYDNYSYIYHREFRQGDFGENVEFLSKPHNVVFEYLVNNGVLGLISYLSLFFFMTYALLFYKKEDGDDRSVVYRIIIVGILLGYFIQNLFIFDSVITYLMFFLVLGLSMGFSSKFWELNVNKDIKIAVSVMIIIISVVSLVLFSILPWRESVKWKDLSVNKNLKEFKVRRAGLQETSLFGGVGDSSSVASKLLSFYVSNQDKINDENKSLFIEEIDSSVSALEKDIEIQPNNYNSYITLSKILIFKMFILGRVDEDIWNYSNSLLMKARELSPEDPRAFLNLSQLYIYKKDYKEARALILESLKSAPLNKDSYSMADRLQKLNYDKEFGEYIESVRPIK